MSFQIKNKDNVAIAITKLDAEAAAFWGKEIHPKKYATPPNSQFNTENWFDNIGYAIHSVREKHKDSRRTEIKWDNVRASLTESYIWEGDSPSSEDLQAIKQIIEPHFNLIKHWEAKGYIPVTIND